jgi:hypothetical protein
MHSEDVTEVIGIINLYALAVDTRRFDLFDRVFTNDIKADFGGEAQWNDLPSLKRDFTASHEAFDATQHITTNHQVVVNSDQAYALSYVNARFIRRMPEGGTLTQSYGWYDDSLIRTDEGWKISKRVCRAIWATDSPLAPPSRFGTPVLQTYALSQEAASGNISYLDKLEAE